MAAKKKTAKNDMSATQKVGIGVGLTAAAVAAAGTYFLYGSKNAAKNRKTVKSWALKAKAEVLEALEKAENMTEEQYHNLVDGVVMAYGKVQNMSKKELKDFEKEMKDHWNKIAKAGKTKAKAAKKATKKVAKKAAKKVAKKASK